MTDIDRPVVLEEVRDALDVVKIQLAEFEQRFEPVRMLENGIAVINRMADVPLLEQTPKKPVFTEMGSSGQSVWTGVVREDYNPELRGKNGLLTYDRMRKSDGQVRGALRLMKTPVLAGRWYVEPGGTMKRDQTIAEFVQQNLFSWMTSSWSQTLQETMLMLDFGYFLFEKVFDKQDGKVILRKLAPRHPLDIVKWNFDNHGGPESVEFYKRDKFGTYDEVTIPIWKLLVFTYDKEGGDMTGVSALRSVYKHWFMKENLYKIDAIQKERHGIGIPLIKLPPNFNEKDMALADEIGRNLRTNEKAHIVLPPNWEVAMLDLLGQPVNAIESVDHHNQMIANNVLAPFLNVGSSKESDIDMFLKSERYIADIIRDVFNNHLIPQLVNWNWTGVKTHPELRVRRIGDTRDWRTFSFAIRNFVGAQIITPDDTLETWMRDELDLPQADPDTARTVGAPQNPAEGGGKGAASILPASAGMSKSAFTHMNQGVGGGAPKPPTPPPARLPRQSTAGNMKIGTGSSAVGNDRSGSK